MVTQTRWLRALALGTATLVLSSVATLTPLQAATADTAPASGTASTVSSDSLPTVQVNGVVWTQKVVGNTVYVGGDFTQAQPAGAAAGANVSARADMLAYNLTTGELVAGFAPNFNGQVRSIDASADGSRIYVGGQFNQVNGAYHTFVTALNPTTGAVLSGFNPVVNAPVYSVAASGSTLFFGGQFTSVNSISRARAASVNATTGALTAWAPAVADQTVRALVVSPDGGRVALGGNFTSLNGGTSPGRGLGAVDSATGASVTWNVGKTIYAQGTKASIYSLASDGTNVYGTGYVYGSTADGNLEGAFNASWTNGDINWIEDCHGDTYSVAALGDSVYTVSHAHYCGNVPGGFQQTDPDPSKATKQHALAFSRATTGTLLHDSQYGEPYADFGDQPAPSLLTWFPDLKEGTYTGQSQAAWSVATGNGYVLLGGEFPTVNGVRQTGLARFATRNLAPNKDGPRLSGGAFKPTVVSLSAGTARVSWPSNWDRDNENLTYSLYRGGISTTPIYTTTRASDGFWNRPQLGYVDKGLTPGATVNYRLRVTDPLGNTVLGDSVNAVIASASASSPYSNQVLADGATDYWRLGEANGTTNYDYAGFSDLMDGTAVTPGASGAIQGDSNTADTFSGAQDGTSLAATSTQVAGPNTFSIGAWFKTTSTSGGKIVGFGDRNTGNSSSYDRHVFMDENGTVYFGVYPGFGATVQSSGGLNDGKWHQVVASLGSGGMQLWIDGKRVGARTDVTYGQAYNGYWRVGGDSSWAGANYFGGAIDDVAIYPTVLSKDAIQKQFTLAGYSGLPTAPSDSYGSAVYKDSPDLYWRLGDAAGSTTAKDSSGNDDPGVAQNGVGFGGTSGIAGTTDTSATFDGDDDQVVASQATNNPTTYSEELWFKTGTTRGGKLIGFGNASSGTSSSYDRHVWMEDNGKLVFGTYTGQLNTAETPLSYNDNLWHHMVATQGSDGMTLYVDGKLAATNPQTSAQGYSGYWRIGGDTTWFGASSNYFAGAIDDAAVYSYVLTSSQVSSHYAAGGGSANAAPTAAFTANTSGLTFTADGSTSSDSDGTVSSYAWDYGDGSTGTGVAVSHAYAVAGTYQVSLTVRDNGGATGTVVKSVTVTAPNQAPTARFTSAVNDLGVAVDGSMSSDPDGTIASYAWDFGDGGTATTATPTHAYAAAGTYSVKLTVTDDKGATDSVTKSVTVTAANQPPSAAFTSSSTALTASFDGSGSSDPDGTVASYAWDFGDGASAATAKPTHTYAAAGSYLVKLTVTDDKGATNSVTKSVAITPANQRPVASFTSSAANLAASFDGSDSSDPDGTVASYAWDFGDGSSAATVKPSHTYAAAGSYSVKLTVTDDKGATDSVNKLVTITAAPAANQPPVASFTSSSTGLAASFDGSGSSDSDGTVASYAWDFGDGSSATTVKPSHTYAAAGSYSVKLTVMDDKGSTNSVTKAVTITAPATVLAQDAFGRTVSNGLGTSDTGGAWTIPAAATSFSVGSGVAAVSNKAGSTLSGYLNDVSSTASDVTTTIALPTLPIGGSAYAGVVGRRAAGDDYGARLAIMANGSVNIEVLHGGTALKTATVSGLSYTAGTQLRLRLQVTGTSPTTIQARVWKAGSTEPTTWQAAATDTAAALQTAGSVGLRTYFGSAGTNGPLTIMFDDLLAKPLN